MTGSKLIPTSTTVRMAAGGTNSPGVGEGAETDWTVVGIIFIVVIIVG